MTFTDPGPLVGDLLVHIGASPDGIAASSLAAFFGVDDARVDEVLIPLVDARLVSCSSLVLGETIVRLRHRGMTAEIALERACSRGLELNEPLIY